jgi:hypothetical protein
MRLVNKTGYLKGAKTAKNPVNIIPSSLITTQGMAFPIKANGKTLYPNTGQYKFPTSPVVETPLKQQGTKSAKPEFGSLAYFNNLFGFKTAKNPTVDKKRNAQLMKQYETATKRGLSSEGLGDLALGLSGEALVGAGVKAGSRLYKATSPYVKKAYNVAKGYGEDLIQTFKGNNKLMQGSLGGSKSFLNSPALRSNKIVANTFKRRGNENNQELAKYISNKINIPESVDRANLENIIKKHFDRVQSDEYISRRMATSGETKDQIASSTKQWINDLADNTEYNIQPVSKNMGSYSNWKGKHYVNVNENIHQNTPEKFLDVFEHEFLHGLSPALKNNKLYKNYPKLDVTPKRSIVQKIKDQFNGRQRSINYLNDPTEQQVRANRLNEKIRKDLKLDNQDKLSNENINEYFDKHYNPNFKTLNKTGFKDVTDILDVNATTKNRSRDNILDWLNKAWMVPAVGAAGVAAQQKKNGAKLVKYKNGSKSVSLAFSRGEKDPKGGLTQKGVDKYNRATGGNLKMAVTTPPSKLKPGSKAANRRKSFCSRMKGMKSKLTSAKTANDPNSRINKSLRKWNC